MGMILQVLPWQLTCSPLKNDAWTTIAFPFKDCNFSAEVRSFSGMQVFHPNTESRWWFQTFAIFTPIWGDDLIWPTNFFSSGVFNQQLENHDRWLGWNSVIFSPPKIWCPTCKLSIFSISSCDVGSFDIRCQAYQKLRLGRLGVILRGYHPPKFNECPLKSDYFKRKYIWTNHHFSGDIRSFSGV